MQTVQKCFGYKSAEACRHIFVFDLEITFVCGTGLFQKVPKRTKIRVARADFWTRNEA